MKITIRIYRTHDFDLMALYQAGNFPLAQAMKQAIVAYYCGEHFVFTVKRTEKPDAKNMPLVTSLILEISDNDVPGIEMWIKGITKGYRNSCFKAIFRHYLEDPCVTFFRDDGSATKLTEVQNEPITLATVKRRRKRKLLPTQEWIDAVADGSIEENKTKKDLQTVNGNTDTLDEEIEPLPQPKKKRKFRQPVVQPTIQNAVFHNQAVEETENNVKADTDEMTQDYNEENDFDSFEAFEGMM